MESFWSYREKARKKGPDPYWTPVVPLHRLVSFPLSYLYASLGIPPLAITFLGLVLVVAGAAVLLWQPTHVLGLVAGVVLLKLGVVHDYCDGEVARYRIAKGIQSPRFQRVGIFADIWVFTVLVQAMMPALLGLFAWRVGAPGGLWWAWAGIATAFILISSYVVGFGKAAYWPNRAPDYTRQSPTFTSGAAGPLKWAQTVYFQLFETAVFTTHLCVVLVLWGLAKSNPTWVLAYAAACIGILALAFLVAHVRALATFDAE